MKNRYHFLDNLRWVTVLLVLFYHVFYNFNSLGVFGAVGGFTDHQWQDIFCTLLNPWFMTLMFVVAGASSRYALQRRTPSEFRRERTRKLLVPSTLGLFVFGFVLGLLNMSAAGAQMPEGVPLFVKWLIAIPSGTGPLWFIQLLFGYSLVEASPVATAPELLGNDVCLLTVPCEERYAVQEGMKVPFTNVIEHGQSVRETYCLVVCVASCTGV